MEESRWPVAVPGIAAEWGKSSKMYARDSVHSSGAGLVCATWRQPSTTRCRATMGYVELKVDLVTSVNRIAIVAVAGE